MFEQKQCLAGRAGLSQASHEQITDYSIRSITLVEILVLVEVLVQSRSPDGGDGAVPPSSKVVALTWARIRPTDVGT